MESGGEDALKPDRSFQGYTWDAEHNGRVIHFDVDSFHVDLSRLLACETPCEHFWWLLELQRRPGQKTGWRFGREDGVHMCEGIYVYVFMYVFTYVCLFVCIHVRVYACMHKVCACMSVCVYECKHVLMYVCTDACRHVCRHACMHT